VPLLQQAAVARPAKDAQINTQVVRMAGALLLAPLSHWLIPMSLVDMGSGNVNQGTNVTIARR
jgi:hypothetical protein